MPYRLDAHPATGETVPAYAVKRGGDVLEEVLNAGRAAHARDARHRVSSERRASGAVPLVSDSDGREAAGQAPLPDDQEEEEC